MRVDNAQSKLPVAYRSRPLSAADAAAWRQLVDAAEQVDGTSVSYYPEDFLEDVLDGRVDPLADTVGVFSGDALIGYSVLPAKVTGAGLHRLTMEGCVAPEYRRRGVGTQLIGWSARRARERHARVCHRRQSSVTVWVPEQNADLRALVEQNGYVAKRWWYEISCQLDKVAPLPVPELPAGFVLRPVRDQDMAQLRETHNASFAGQWEDGTVSPEQWRQDFVNDPLFQPDLSYLLVDESGAIVSYVLTQEVGGEADGSDEYELRINYLGTPPKWRGQGFFRHLTAVVDQRARQEAYDYLGFTVDSENPTGALRVFERANMFDWNRDHWECWICYSAVLPSGAGQP